MKKGVKQNALVVQKEAQVNAQSGQRARAGRPEKFTLDQIIQALRDTKGMIYLAAARMRCSPQTIYNYVRKHEVVKAEIETQKGEMLDTAELALYNAILRGEAWAVCFTLKTLGKDRGYVERQEVRIKDEDVDVTKLSNAELLAILNQSVLR